MPILDAYGRPVDTRALKNELAAPSLTGIRQAISDHPAQGLTPRRLANLLREAEFGYPQRYLELAEEMEEKDLHYRSVLQTRKLAPAGLELVVDAASEDAEDVRAAELVRDVFAQDALEDVLVDLLDAIGKGFAVCEILWETTSRWWMPREIVWRDPRWFLFSQADGRTILLQDDAAPLGLPLPPYKFVTHVPRIKSGLPLRGGLARAAAWGYLFKNFTLKDWMAFIEIYGQPIRIGKYEPGTDKADIDILKEAVANIGSDASAVMLNGMMIEFVDSIGKAASAQVFERYLDYLDKQVSKAVLGHTGSTDSTPGRLGGETEAREVRSDILRSDAAQLGKTLTRDIARPVVDLNLGPRPVYPRVRLVVAEPEDLTALAGNLDKLVGKGLKVGQVWARQKFGIPDPGEGEELLGGTAPPAPPGENPADGTPPAPPAAAARIAAETGHAHACPHCAAARAAGTITRDVADDYTDQAAVASLPMMDGLIEPVRKLVMGAKSMEEIRDGLLDLYTDMPVTDLANLIAQAMAAAELAGRYEVKNGR
jgi:phage gp29-like protein